MKHHDDRIDYIELPATDIPATKTFYTAVVGWKFTDYGPDYVAFADGDLEGGFPKVTTNRSGGPLVILYSSALEQTQAQTVSQGRQSAEPSLSFPGGRRFHFLYHDG